MKLVLIAGGSAAGKSLLATEVQSRLGSQRVAVIAHDAYYLDLAHLPMMSRAEFNFDSPAALETSLLLAHVDALQRGEAVRVPEYAFETHTRKEATTLIEPRPLVVVEGLHVLGVEGLRSRAALKLFLETGPDEMLARRVARDVDERGRSAESVRGQWHGHVLPMYERHVAPTREHADLVLDGGRPVEELFMELEAHLDTEP